MNVNNLTPEQARTLLTRLEKKSLRELLQLEAEHRTPRQNRERILWLKEQTRISESQYAPGGDLAYLRRELQTEQKLLAGDSALERGRLERKLARAERRYAKELAPELLSMQDLIRKGQQAHLDRLRQRLEDLKDR